jgi:hypothetical protein
VGSGRIFKALFVSLVAVSSTVACGGTSVKRGDPDDAGGTGGTGTGAGATGGSSKGGSGGSSKGGTGGTTGGTGATSGTGTTGGANATGGNGCFEAPCIPVECPDGKLIPRECACPFCSCEDVACTSADCPAGQVPTRLPGACCDSCVDAPPLPGCSSVMCLVERECGPDRVWERPVGACCAGCVPTEPTACPEILCSPIECPRGYVAGDGSNGCCSECVPDPDFCETDYDCLIAKNLTDCCACDQAVSVRRYDEDLCLSARRLTRPIPAECAAPADCDSDCSCGTFFDAACVNNTCAPLELGLQ